MTYRKSTTITEVIAQLRRHTLTDIADRVVMCSCGRWFPAPDAYSAHVLEEAEDQLRASRPRGPAVTRELLAEVARIHREAPDGEKTREVAAFLGVSRASAGTYVSRARKLGLLEVPL